MNNLKELSKVDAQDATALALAAYPAPTTTDIDNSESNIRGGDEDIQSVFDEAWETEHHLHNYGRWFGKSANQAGNNWGTETSLTVFQASSNAGDFGTAIKVLGTDDTPNQPSMLQFDLHRLLISEMSSDVPYILRIIHDVDGDGVANTAEGKGYYTDVMIIPSNTPVNRAGGTPVDIIDKRDVSGMRVWAKVKAAGSVDIDFFVGIHEYER